MTITGSIEQAPYDSYLYSDCLNGDVIFRSINSNSFIFGFNSNVPSGFSIKQTSGTFVNGNSNTQANMTLYRARSNNTALQTNDVIGSLNFGCRFGASTSCNVTSISSLYTGTGTTKSGALLFNTECNAGMTERMRLTDAGNFGIGTPSPSGILHARTAKRTQRQLSFYNNTNTNQWYDYSTLYSKYSSNQWYFETSNNTICTIAFSGSSNTQSRVTNLQYSSNGTWVAVPADGTILPFYTPATMGGGITIFELEDSAPVTITDKTNIIKTFTATSSGLVGIGKSNPAYNLDVVGDINLTGTLRQNGTSFGGGVGWAANGANIYSSSNIGIGKSNPAYKLDVAGPISSSSSDVYNRSLIMINNASYNHVILGSNLANNACGVFSYTNGNLGMSIYGQSIYSLCVSSNGYVGIGTSTPSYPLHVSGAIFATGDITGLSDIRAKSDLQPIENAIEKINKLSGYTYLLKDPITNRLSDTRHAGLIAQEVQKVLPEVVNENSEGQLSLAYGNMMSLVIEALKELSEENKSLKATVLELCREK